MTKPVYDWEGLRAKIEAAGLPQHKTMVATMPQHAPIRPMTGVINGIYPNRTFPLLKDDPNETHRHPPRQVP